MTVHGFVAPGSTANTVTARTNTAIFADATGWDNFCVEDDTNRGMLRTNSPEVARRFRRTVYTHEDWKKHRQQDRFLIYLGSMFKSGVFENCKNEVLVTTAIATFVCVYNGLRGGYVDLAGVSHPALFPGQVIGLPMNAFTLTGSSLGLLLSKSMFLDVSFLALSTFLVSHTHLQFNYYVYFYKQLSVQTPRTSDGTKPERIGE